MSVNTTPLAMFSGSTRMSSSVRVTNCAESINSQNVQVVSGLGIAIGGPGLGLFTQYLT